MAANSFRLMTVGDKAKGIEPIINRTVSGMFARLEDIHVKPDFNRREDDERTQAADEDLFQYLMNGGTVPPLECIPRDEGGVWVVEGHRRRKAYQRCADAGKPVNRIHITPFDGNDVERIARIMTSNNQLALSKMEQAAVVKDLKAFNLTTAEIAKLVSKSIPTVEMLLTLASADRSVQQSVRDGELSANLAATMTKEHGENAASVVAEAVATAKEQGAKKATAKTIKAPEISAKKARELVEIVSNIGVDDNGCIKLDGTDLLAVLSIIAEHTGIKDNRSGKK